ncbi:MAG: siphovirus Gp157 family protein [Burkholderiaceae bacterium]|jgi:hypothetical protein|nr:siphovirus Gp157 family protein [Burkholderiaceae bacterium]
MNALTLYDIAALYRADADKLAELDLDDQVVLDTLESMSGALEVKAQNVVAFARNLQASAAAIKQAEEQMAARRKAIERRAASLLHYTQTAMQVAGVQKIECPWFRLSIQSNPPAVHVFEPGLVPGQFMRTPEPPPPAPDKTAIAKALKAGQDVPGCQLVQSQRLVIS